MKGAPLSPEVMAFAVAMQRKLDANEREKGHWSGCDAQYLSMRLTQEREELRRAVKRGNAREILDEAADVANFCMMIADNAGAFDDDDDASNGQANRSE